MANKEVRQAIFSPNSAAEASMEFIDELKKTSEFSIPLYLTNFDKATPDKRFTPLRPGNMISVMMNNSQGKTSFAVWHALQRALWLRDHGIMDRAVVFVTAEVMVETLFIQITSALSSLPYASVLSGDMGDEDFKAFNGFAATKMPNLPIWIVGHSGNPKRKVKNLRISDQLVDQSLSEIENWGPHSKHIIDICYVDYLQQLSLDNKTDLSRSAGKVEMVSQMTHNLKGVAMNHACVMWLNTQSNRDIEQSPKTDKMPGSADSAWSADLERVTDVLMAAWRPIKYYGDGVMFKANGDRVYTAYPWQWFLKCYKHRFGPSGMWAEINYNAALCQFEVPKTKTL